MIISFTIVDDIQLTRRERERVEKMMNFFSRMSTQAHTVNRLGRRASRR